MVFEASKKKHISHTPPPNIKLNNCPKGRIIILSNMLFIKKAAFIAAFIPALSFASKCSDDQSFTFRLDFNDFVQRCDWITMNEDRTEYRRENYCNRGEIKGACPVSCDICPCEEDDLSFQFTTTFSWESVECDWLVKNFKNASTRKANYCPVQEIGSACAKACGFCMGEGGTPAPTDVPSASPSAAPTGDPTLLPSSTPTISMIPTDLSTTQPSVSMGPTITGTMRPTSSPSSNPPARPSIAGTRKPSTSPSSNPSARPSIAPTTRPSISPSKAPTALPSKSPTMSPIVGCADDPNFTFNLDSGDQQSCDWLLQDDMETRFNIYCGRGHVKTACKNACRFCTCEDPLDYTFNLNNGNTVACDWFSGDNVLLRQQRYCFDKNDARVASEIGSACVVGCEFCTR